ncbi:MAG: hypothetical protein SPK75_02270 [Victivallales bacterium]|nr:hypothetical protein [Victivallales bacterium]
MFKVEGEFDVVVREAFMSEARFEAKPGEVNSRQEPVQTYGDVCLLLEDKDGNTDTWHGEISNRNGIGTKAHLYRTDLTLKTLQEIGFGVTSLAELGGQFVAESDGTVTIPNLVGMEATVTTEYKDYEKRDGTAGRALRIKYLNAKGSHREKKLSMAEVMKRFGMGGQAQAVPAPMAPMDPQGYMAQPTPPQIPPQMPQAPVPAPQMPQMPNQPKCPY